MALKTIEEYNDERQQAREEMSKTGILCPECEASELRWLDNNCFTSYPPRRAVKCHRCHWAGTVEA